MSDGDLLADIFFIESKENWISQTQTGRADHYTTHTYVEKSLLVKAYKDATRAADRTRISRARSGRVTISFLVRGTLFFFRRLRELKSLLLACQVRTASCL